MKLLLAVLTILMLLSLAAWKYGWWILLLPLGIIGAVVVFGILFILLLSLGRQ